MNDIIDRLKEACNGHPTAKIPWPHRLLHDAIAEIERLQRPAITFEELARDAWTDLVDKDDRTSPEEYPDMALITAEELREFMERAAQPQR